MPDPDVARWDEQLAARDHRACSAHGSALCSHPVHGGEVLDGVVLPDNFSVGRRERSQDSVPGARKHHARDCRQRTLVSGMLLERGTQFGQGKPFPFAVSKLDRSDPLRDPGRSTRSGHRLRRPTRSFHRTRTCCSPGRSSRSPRLYYLDRGPTHFRSFARPPGSYAHLVESSKSAATRNRDPDPVPSDNFPAASPRCIQPAKYLWACPAPTTGSCRYSDPWP